MFIPVEQRPETTTLSHPFIATALSVTALADNTVARHPEPSVELPRVTEELLIEEVSIDGMCGVY